MRSAQWRSSGRAAPWPGCRRDLPVVGMIPVHVGGMMMNVDDDQGVCGAARSLGGRRRGARVSGRLAAGAGRAVAALRAADRRRLVLLVLRQQDDHDRRRRHGGDGGCRAGRADAPDVAARPVARRLGPVLGQRRLGLSDPRAGLQVQPDGHRGGDRHPPARPCRGDAPRPRSDRAASTCERLARRRGDRAAADRLPTASTPGTCSRSGCGSRR